MYRNESKHPNIVENNCFNAFLDISYDIWTYPCSSCANVMHNRNCHSKPNKIRNIFSSVSKPMINVAGYQPKWCFKIFNRIHFHSKKFHSHNQTDHNSGVVLHLLCFLKFGHELTTDMLESDEKKTTWDHIKSESMLNVQHAEHYTNKWVEGTLHELARMKTTHTGKVMSKNILKQTW